MTRRAPRFALILLAAGAVGAAPDPWGTPAEMAADLRRPRDLMVHDIGSPDVQLDPQFIAFFEGLRQFGLERSVSAMELAASAARAEEELWSVRVRNRAASRDLAVRLRARERGTPEDSADFRKNPGEDGHLCRWVVPRRNQDVWKRGLRSDRESDVFDDLLVMHDLLEEDLGILFLAWSPLKRGESLDLDSGFLDSDRSAWDVHGRVRVVTGIAEHRLRLPSSARRWSSMQGWVQRANKMLEDHRHRTESSLRLTAINYLHAVTWQQSAGADQKLRRSVDGDGVIGRLLSWFGLRGPTLRLPTRADEVYRVARSWSRRWRQGLPCGRPACILRNGRAGARRRGGAVALRFEQGDPAALARQFVLEARVALLDLAAAVRGHEAFVGHPPADLSQLVDQYMTAIPRDPRTLAHPRWSVDDTHWTLAFDPPATGTVLPEDHDLLTLRMRRLDAMEEGE